MDKRRLFTGFAIVFVDGSAIVAARRGTTATGLL
jgi:hypothetical protein